MKYLSVYTPDAKAHAQTMSKEQMAEMGKLMEETTKSGALVLTGGILPVAKGGARVRISGGEITVDGPFTETKEIVGGFAIMEAKSREEAIEMVRSFLKIAGDGESELHQITEAGGRPNQEGRPNQ
jgi:hypothetical protein